MVDPALFLCRIRLCVDAAVDGVLFGIYIEFDKD